MSCTECQTCYECQMCVTCQGQCETCQTCYQCERGIIPQQPRQMPRTFQPMPQMTVRPIMPQDPLLMKLNEISVKLDTLIDSISSLVKALQIKIERVGEIDREKLKPSK